MHVFQKYTCIILLQCSINFLNAHIGELMKNLGMQREGLLTEIKILTLYQLTSVFLSLLYHHEPITFYGGHELSKTVV